MGFFQRSQLTYELVVAVYNLLVPAEASLQVLVLHKNQSTISVGPLIDSHGTIQLLHPSSDVYLSPDLLRLLRLLL
jgi:hypothetical protein